MTEPIRLNQQTPLQRSVYTQKVYAFFGQKLLRWIALDLITYSEAILALEALVATLKVYRDEEHKTHPVRN